MKKLVWVGLLLALTCVALALPRSAYAVDCDGCVTQEGLCQHDCYVQYYPQNIPAMDLCNRQCDRTMSRCLRGCSI